MLAGRRPVDPDLAGVIDRAKGQPRPRPAPIGRRLDRPLVPIAMAVLWYLNIIPGSLALIFAIQDFGSFLWTLSTWRSESRLALTS